MSAGWVKFENTTPDNLKVASLSDKGFRLWVNAICYCSRGRTSGKVPAAVITSLSLSATKRTVTELLEAGLLDQLDAKTYLVHDYLDYNPSRERIEEMRSRNRDRVAQWRAEQTGNGVTGEGDVTALQEDYPHVRDRSESLPSPSSSSRRESKPGREPSKRADQDEFPASLPSELVPVGREALRVLEAVQLERGGYVPTARGVGLALIRYPNRDHMAVARELEHWALAGSGQGKEVKDWARTFTTFLGRAPAGSASTVRGGQILPFRRGESTSEIYQALNGEAS